MSRTDDLRQGGATDLTGEGGGGGAPFVKWPTDTPYAYVEGELLKIWEGKYGKTATIKVSDRSEGLIAKGKDEEGEPYSTTPKIGDEVNVGLNLAALEGRLTDDHIGQQVHIAFEGWAESKAGDTTYRLFTVLVMNGRAGGEEPPKTEEPPQAAWPDEATSDAQAEAHVPPDDDDLGF